MRNDFIKMIAIFIASLSMPALAELNRFEIDSLKAIEADNMGEPWLLVIWSTDCPPCYLELDMISKLKALDSDLKIVIISSDAPENRESVLRVMHSLNLDKVESWHYAASNVAALQYSIDPLWRGEIPRSYFYQLDGERCAVSGILKEKKVVSWLSDPSSNCK